MFAPANDLSQGFGAIHLGSPSSITSNDIATSFDLDFTSTLTWVDASFTEPHGDAVFCIVSDNIIIKYKSNAAFDCTPINLVAVAE